MSDLELLTIGRVNFDLYAQQRGVPFVEVLGWDSMVGGSPVNVALAGLRLGVTAGVLTAVGEDLVGDWVRAALAQQGVDVRFVARKSGPHTSLALRAQQAPDHPLAFYRQDPADIYLADEDVADAPVEKAQALLVSADALARGLMIETCRAVIARARKASVTTYLDLDLRDVNWPDLRVYAERISAVVADVDVMIGTDAEFATLLELAPETEGDAVVAAVEQRLAPSGDRVLLVKHGQHGATLLAGGDPVAVAAFEVEEASTVGAGDSFAAGLIASRIRGEEWPEAVRYAAACAAITVSRFGCSTGFPHAREVATFLRTRASSPVAVETAQ